MPILLHGNIRFRRRWVACFRVRRRSESPENSSVRRQDVLIRCLGPTTPDEMLLLERMNGRNQPSGNLTNLLPW
jgi:hypothetical protein